MDLQPLVETLAKASMGRVLPYFDLTVEREFSKVTIPVREVNTSDKTDLALRRFAADWLRTNLKNIGVDHRFEKVTGVSWYTDAVGETPAQEFPVVGLFVVSWWPKPELTEHEQFHAYQRAKREAARKGEDL